MTHGGRTGARAPRGTSRWGAIVWFFTACTVPQLSDTGTILCASDGTCPDGDLCVGAVCCPSVAGGPAATCAPPRCVSTMTCPSALTCVNSWCCGGADANSGQCAAGEAACDQPPSGSPWPGPTSAGTNVSCPEITAGVGTPCNGDGNCITHPATLPLLTCLTGAPGGYCSRACDPLASTTLCPANTLCAAIAVGQGVARGVCVRECTLPPGQTWARCRFGNASDRYACVIPDGFQTPVCVPDCTLDPTVCPSHCNVTTHACSRTE